MPRENNTLRVKASPGEPLVYIVESWETPSAPHRVELTGYMGNSECDCHDFTKRCLPNWKNNGNMPVEYLLPGSAKPNPKRTRCKHITVAHRSYLNKRLEQLAFNEGQQYERTI